MFKVGSRLLGLRLQAERKRGWGLKLYPNPKYPTSLGFLIMISLYESLKKGKVGFRSKAVWESLLRVPRYSG